MVKGLKISNVNSSVPKQEDNSYKEEFEKKATEVFQNHEKRNNELMSSVAKFIPILDDKILEENKSPLVKDLEKEVVLNLIKAAKEINNDESEEEGSGSIALINLMLRMFLKQRNKINELSHKLSLQEIEIIKIKKKSVDEPK